MAGDIRIGCSGWSYRRHFDTVEPNNSFYRQPARERFVAWQEQAPPGFLFAVKGRRYVTHIKRLAVEQKSIDLVVEAALGLGDSLGPILFQLHANFRLDLERLDRFVAMLPKDLRFTFEFRHDSWLVCQRCSNCCGRTASRSASAITQKCRSRSRSRATSHI